MDDALWTLDELVELVAAVLSDGYEGAPNGRVRGLPDRRAVRWYTTVGLVDRPAAMRGRTALYGPRHLLQLVAIKRRQAAGRSLADIQHELSGATEKALRDVAHVPDTYLHPATPTPAAPAAPGASVDVKVRHRFWAAVPTRADVEPAAGGALSARSRPGGAGVPAVAADDGRLAVDPDGAGSAGGALAGPAGDTLGGWAAALHGFALPGGAMLILPAGAPAPGDDDRAALRAAAQPLLDELARRGLVPAGWAHPADAAGWSLVPDGRARVGRPPEPRSTTDTDQPEERDES